MPFNLCKITHENIWDQMIWGAGFSLLHLVMATLTTRWIKRIPPVLLHAATAFSTLILMMIMQARVGFDFWISFSLLAFSSSSYLFLFGTIYKSLTLRILLKSHSLNIDQMGNLVTLPTFTDRIDVLTTMGKVEGKKGRYYLTQEGKKTARFFQMLRKIFRINTKAVYGESIRANSFRRSKILILTVFCLSVLLYISGLHQKLDLTQDDRIRFHAVPVAISTLYQGHKHDYRGWRTTELPFQNHPLTDEFIAKQIKSPVDKSQGHYYWVADDRGFADFVIASFALFGPHLRSLFNFWFVLFLVSVALFTLSFGKYEWAMGCLALLILGIHSAVSLLKLHLIDVAIYEPRYLDVLAIIPVFHVIFFATIQKSQDFKIQIFTLLGQLLIFTFLYHARSSLGWEILPMIGVPFFMILKRKKWKQIVPPVFVISLLIGFLFSLNAYKHQTYNKKYFQEMGPRTFWHNALMGLTDNVSDYEVADMVIKFGKNSPACPSCVANLEAQQLLNTLGNHGEADWTAYESCAKKLYFSLLRQDVFHAIKLYLFNKPLDVIKGFFSPEDRLFLGLTLKEKDLPWNPFHPLYWIPCVLIILLSGQSLYHHRWELLGILSSVFLAGMIPAICFYSAILTRGGLTVASVAFLYLGILICLYASYHGIRKRRSLQTVVKKNNAI